MYLNVVHFSIYSKDYRIKKDQQKQKTKNDKKNKQPNELHTQHSIAQHNERKGERSEMKKKITKIPKRIIIPVDTMNKSETRVRKTYSHIRRDKGSDRERERRYSKTSISINGKKCERTRDRKTKIMMKKKTTLTELQRKCYVRAVWSIYLYFALLLLVIIVFFSSRRIHTPSTCFFYSFSLFCFVPLLFLASLYLSLSHIHSL